MCRTQMVMFEETGRPLDWWHLKGLKCPGQDVWIVESSLDQVLRYSGGTVLNSGSASPSFTLAWPPTIQAPWTWLPMARDFFVVDDAADRVFVFSLTGSYMGDWQLDPSDRQRVGLDH